MIQSNVNITVEISHAQRSGGLDASALPATSCFFVPGSTYIQPSCFDVLLSFNFSLQDSLKNVVSEFPDTNLHLLSPLKQSIYRSYMLGRAASWGNTWKLAKMQSSFLKDEAIGEKKKKKNHFRQLRFQPGKMCQAQEWAGICSAGPRNQEKQF